MNEEESQTADEEVIEQPADQTVDATKTEEVAAAPAADAKLSDILDEAISDASKTRRPITPKAEETPEAKEAALKADADKIAKEDADAAEKGQVRGPDGKFREMTAEEKAAK